VTTQAVLFPNTSTELFPAVNTTGYVNVASGTTTPVRGKIMVSSTTGDGTVAFSDGDGTAIQIGTNPVIFDVAAGVTVTFT